MEGPSPRVVKETKTLQTDPVPGINVTADPNNFRHFFVVIEGILFFTQVLKALVTQVGNLELKFCYPKIIQ